MRKHLAICVLLLGVPSFAEQGASSTPAADNAVLEQKVKDLEERLIALEGQVRMLKSQAPASTARRPAARQFSKLPRPPLPRRRRRRRGKLAVRTFRRNRHTSAARERRLLKHSTLISA
ncbi:MAG TPA: hypothetical protein VJ453_06135 [Terriglobales bacterium]|nr:hypothetical protein [Terriglobales bacterium]